eukprot:TRINITY_DN80993_c0_g1_i1.p1 TRINITY_DN80993_c0_g1~~TRINITY_DN80993_c0_g1_i1.p1  ORF type:complete len:619 (+),score=115.51 TRINITY_DN80993_c0_g1_i1:34-1890(+)
MELPEDLVSVRGELNCSNLGFFLTTIVSSIKELADQQATFQQELARVAKNEGETKVELVQRSFGQLQIEVSKSSQHVAGLAQQLNAIENAVQALQSSDQQSKKTIEEHVVSLRKLGSMGQKLDGLERAVQQNQNALRAVNERAEGGNSNREIQRLEEIIEQIKKRRESDYRALSHRIDQISIAPLDFQLKELNKQLGDLDQRTKQFTIATDKVTRCDEQLKALIKRHETDIVAANMRIDELSGQRVDDSVKATAKRTERETSEIRRKVELIGQTVDKLREDTQSELTKMRDQTKVFTAKYDSKTREFVQKTQDAIQRVEEIERRDPSEIAAKLERLKARVDGSMKDVFSRLSEVNSRIDSMQTGGNEQFNAQVREIVSEIATLSEKTTKIFEMDASHKSQLSSLERKIYENIKHIQMQVDDMSADVGLARQSVSKLQQSHETLRQEVESLQRIPEPKEDEHARQGEQLRREEKENPVSQPVAPKRPPTVTPSVGPVWTERPKLGIEVADAKHSQTGETVCTVVKVQPGGACEAAGLEVGDVIEQWNEIPVHCKGDFGQCVERSQLGDAVLLQVRRIVKNTDGMRSQHTLQCEVRIRPAQAAPQFYERPGYTAVKVACA